MYELVQVSEKCYYINCPAKIGVYALDKDNVYLVDRGNVDAIAALVSVNDTTRQSRCIASFHCLALTRTSSTDYFKINATLYESVFEKCFLPDVCHNLWEIKSSAR